MRAAVGPETVLGQVFVPRDLHELVRGWVENHKRCRDLLEEISKLQYEKIRKREI